MIPFNVSFDQAFRKHIESLGFIPDDTIVNVLVHRRDYYLYFRPFPNDDRIDYYDRRSRLYQQQDYEYYSKMQKHYEEMLCYFNSLVYEHYG